MSFYRLIWYLFIAGTNSVFAQDTITANGFVPYQSLSIPLRDSFIAVEGSPLHEAYRRVLSVEEYRIGALNVSRLTSFNRDTLCLFSIEPKRINNRYNAVLVFNTVNQSGIVLRLNQPKVFCSNQGNVFLHGISEFRSLGYLEIFHLTTKGITHCFNSLNVGTGFCVRNSSLECTSYDSLYLIYRMDDFNEDGLPDIHFSGTINYYCEGLEFGVGRLDRSPIRQRHISFELISRKVSMGALGCKADWDLSDYAILKLIPQQE